VGRKSFSWSLVLRIVVIFSLRKLILPLRRRFEKPNDALA